MTVDPATTRLAAGPIAKILDGAVTRIANIPSFLRKTAELNDFLGRTTVQYCQYCIDVYSTIRILGMPKPIGLQQVFTRVKVASDIERFQQRSERDILAEALQGRTTHETYSARHVVHNLPRVVILGRPGSGKSTLLKYMLLDTLLRNPNPQKIPFLIRLNQLKQAQRTIIAEIDAILKKSGVEFSGELAMSLLESGKVMLLIDGLDEVNASDRAKLLTELDDLSHRFRGNSYIVTCRTSVYAFWLADYWHYEMERFSRREIAFFVSRWFSEDRKLARGVAAKILADTRLRNLCSNPLLLTIVCIGYAGTMTISNNRAEIYRDAISTLLQKWDASRSIQREDKYQELTPKRREELLEELAAQTFVDGEIVFRDQRARQVVQEFLSARPLEKGDEPNTTDSGVLEAIESQHGLIEKRSQSLWAFSHLTFQEYFTASYIKNRDPDLQSRVVENFITRPEWREVVMLLAFLLPRADAFVLAILEAILKIGYGVEFGNRLRVEISEARRVLALQKANTGFLFEGSTKRKEGRATTATKIAKLGLSVVEGGVRLSPEDMQKVLVRFVMAVQKRLLRTPFYGEVGQREYIYQFVLARRRALSNITGILRHGEGSSLAAAFDDKSIKLWIRGVFSGLYSRNKTLFLRFNFMLSPQGIFEISERSEIVLTRDIAPIVIEKLMGEVKGMQGLDTDNFLVAPPDVHAKSGEYGMIAILEAFKFVITNRVHATCDLNQKDNVVLSAFSAGETLSEILMAQVYLHPRVREAAVRALQIMLGELPPEHPAPDDPPMEYGQLRHLSG